MYAWCWILIRAVCLGSVMQQMILSLAVLLSQARKKNMFCACSVTLNMLSKDTLYSYSTVLVPSEKISVLNLFENCICMASHFPLM